MTRDDAIAADHVWGIVPLLDQLHLGFVLLDPDGALAHASYHARRLLGRRATAETLQQVLGDDWRPVVGDVLAGRSSGARWRERDGGGALHLSVRSTAVTFGERTGALVSLMDVSLEVGLHARYKQAMARLEQANLDLRRRVAQVLREHEDDLAQFDELLQVAPAIFASFVGEAHGALDQVAGLAHGGELADADVDAGLRATHTLKGNARGLGLHFIAGRAHAVEDLLAPARRFGCLPDEAELRHAVDDLRRAVDRAAALRGRLSAVGGGRALDTVRTIDGAVARLDAARAALAADHPARAALDDAVAALTPLARLPLAEVFEYLRVVARTTAEEAGKPVPDVDTRGGDVAVAPAIHTALAAALPHLVRNAVVHGLEHALDRVERGKAAAGHIAVTAIVDGGALAIDLRDDGRGLDRERLRARAAALGLEVPAPSEGGDPADDLIFHPGLSTAAAVGPDAGRGYGTAAAREAITAVGGELTIRSHPGAGLEVRIVVPLRDR